MVEYRLRALAVHMVPLLAQVTASIAVSCIARRRYQVWMWCGTGSAEGSRPRPRKLTPQIMAPCEIVRHSQDAVFEAPRRHLRGRLVEAPEPLKPRKDTSIHQLAAAAIAV